MENWLTDNIVRICEIFNKHELQFMAVGGVAVALHGYLRLSKNSVGEVIDKPDLDFWYNPNYKNYFRLLDALEELKLDVLEFKQEQTPNPKKSFFRYNLPTFTLDLLPEIKSKLDFQTCFSKKEVVLIQDVPIPFLSFDDLIADKKKSGRAKDIEDLGNLKKIDH